MYIECDQCFAEYNILEIGITLLQADALDEWICGICLGTHQAVPNSSNSSSSSSSSSITSTTSKTWYSYKTAKKDIRKLQGGTGKHLDGDVNGPIDEGGRPFQAQVVLKSQVPGDGSLQVVPGFHWYASKFFTKAGGPIPPGEYYALRDQHETILDPELWWYVKRVPDEWNMKNKTTPSKPVSCKGVAKACLAMKRELEEMPDSLLPQEGDYILWDPRLIHSTGEPGKLNCTGQIRQTFYCAYRPSNPSTKYIAKEQLAYRASGQHPAWGASSHWKAEESPEYVPYELDELGSKLYGDAPWEKVLTAAERRERRNATNTDTTIKTTKTTIKTTTKTTSSRSSKDRSTTKKKKSSSSSSSSSPSSKIIRHLTPRLLAFFVRYGFVVVPNVIQQTKTTKLRKEIASFVLDKYHIDITNEITAKTSLTLSSLRKMISSYGSGMVELFWLHGMDAIRTDPGTYGVFSDLLRGTWFTKTRPFEHRAHIDDPNRLLVYADRTNVRFPANLLNELMEKIRPEGIEPEDEITMAEEAARVAEETRQRMEARKRKRQRNSGSGRHGKRLHKYRTITLNERKWIPDVQSLRAIDMVHAAVTPPFFNTIITPINGNVEYSNSSNSSNNNSNNSNNNNNNNTNYNQNDVQNFLIALRSDVVRRLSSNGDATTQYDNEDFSDWLFRRKKEWSRDRMGTRILRDVREEIELRNEVKNAMERMVLKTMSEMNENGDGNGDVNDGSQIKIEQINKNHEIENEEELKTGSEKWLKKRKALWAGVGRVRKIMRLNKNGHSKASNGSAISSSSSSSSTSTSSSSSSSSPSLSSPFGSDIKWLKSVVSRGMMIDGGASLLPSKKSILISFYMKYNPEKLQHIDVILQFYDGLKNENVDKLWLDFKAQYGVDPRNFVSALSQHLIEVEENTNVEILEVVQELLGMVEKKEQPVVVAVKKE